MAKFIISAFADEAGDTLAEQIGALHRNGIGCIEPRAIDKQGVIFKSEEELRRIRRELDAAGIRTSSLGSPIGKYPIDDPFETHLEDFKRALNAAHILGTNYIRMFSFFVPTERRAECREEVLSRLSVMLDMAEHEGITLCHENEAKIYGEQPEEIKDLLTSLPRLGGIFDPANYVVCDADPTLGIDVTLPSLVYMHVKDATRDGHLIVPAGEGDGHIGEALDKINRSTDRAIYLTLEPHLKVFSAYASIDDRTLRNKYVFETATESFDCAANALKGVLRAGGYHENGQYWTK